MVPLMFYKGYSDSSERQEWRQGGWSPRSSGVSASAAQGLSKGGADPSLEHKLNGGNPLCYSPGVPVSSARVPGPSGKDPAICLPCYFPTLRRQPGT